MTSYPNFAVSQLSTAYFLKKYEIKKFQARKKSAFLPQNDLHPFWKDGRSYKKIDFRLFIFLIYFKK